MMMLKKFFSPQLVQKHGGVFAGALVHEVSWDTCTQGDISVFIIIITITKIIINKITTIIITFKGTVPDF